MNIFILHHDPVKAARMYCDKHVTKMTVETAQLLSYVHRIRNPKYAEEKSLYKLSKSHTSHPCTLWLLESEANYRWTFILLKALLNEYDYRYKGLSRGKYKRIQDMLLPLSHIPRGYGKTTNTDPTDFVLAVNKYPECIGDCAVESYRRFYIMDKRKFAKWKNNRKPPKWWVEGIKQFRRMKNINLIDVA